MQDQVEIQFDSASVKHVQKRIQIQTVADTWRLWYLSTALLVSFEQASCSLPATGV